MAKVRFEGLSKSFGATSVLRDVTLSVADGEFLTLLGPSGCGKSTLLRILAGLDVQSAGTVFIGHQPVDNLKPKLRDIAMVFQSYALYPHMSVGANMALPLLMRQLSPWQRLPLLGRLLPGTRRVKGEIDTEVRRTASALGIEQLLGRKPSQLSGGQRQRVAVGRAIVRRPAVFLMDEPLSNLDAKLRVALRAEIKELHERLGVTFIYVTHDQAEAMTLSDRVAVMLDGELLQVAPPHLIYADPDDRRVAEFVGSPKINMLDAVTRAPGIASVGALSLPISASLAPNTELTLGIRPEAFHLAQRAGAGTISGSVRLLEHMGSDLYVHLDVAGIPDPVIARLLAERAPHISHRQFLHLGVHAEHVLLFSRSGQRLRPRPLESRTIALGEVAP